MRTRKPLSWRRLADGRVHRMKQGKHFLAEPRAFEVEVRRHAAELGKAVRTLREELGVFRFYNYLWVQFADNEISPGAPCLCGNTALMRAHQYFGRCPECGRSLIFRPQQSPLSERQIALAREDTANLWGSDRPAVADSEWYSAAAENGGDLDADEVEATGDLPEDGGDAAAQPALQKGRLNSYTDVVLRLWDRTPRSERWCGYGVDPRGRRVLLIVDLPLDEIGDRMADPDRPGEFIYRLSAWLVEPFSDVIDLDRLGPNQPRAD